MESIGAVDENVINQLVIIIKYVCIVQKKNSTWLRTLPLGTLETVLDMVLYQPSTTTLLDKIRVQTFYERQLSALYIYDGQFLQHATVTDFQVQSKCPGFCNIQINNQERH